MKKYKRTVHHGSLDNKKMRIASVLLAAAMLFVLLFGSFSTFDTSNESELLDKNFDYEFYSVNGNENHIVAFMPDYNIFTFEIGTYTIENKSELILDTPTGKETYSFSNPTEDGFVTLIKDGESLQYKTTASEGGFTNGFIKGIAPFEHYATFYDQASACQITFDTDGTFVRQNHFEYEQHMGHISILDSYADMTGDKPSDDIMYQYTFDERLGTVNLEPEKSFFAMPHASYQLVRMDNFDDDGIERGTFVGLNDKEFKYKRVLMETLPNAQEGDITYRIVYTNDLSITGEQITQDSLSGTFIPASEKEYQFLHIW